jgi:hypothetical protein
MTSEEIGEFFAWIGMNRAVNSGRRGSRTFAHVSTATDITGVLWSGGIDPATDREEAVGGPLSRVGDDLVKVGQEALGLGSNLGVRWRSEKWRVPREWFR